MLLSVDVFVDVILHGRWSGPPGMPIAFETRFEWVLAGSTESCSLVPQVTTHHVSCATGDEILQKFWEVEDGPFSETIFSPVERSAIKHFKANQTHTKDGRFVAPLPKRENAKRLGESRSQAVQRFLLLERSLWSSNQIQNFAAVMEEYYELGHAETVPQADLNKPLQEIFYLPMHAVHKESSTTTS